MHRSVLAGAILLLGAACGGGSTGPGSDPVLAKAAPSGDAQSGAVGTTLPNPLRVSLTLNGAPAAGRTVSWTLLANGGAVAPANSTTGADGIASTSVTLPPFAASSQVRATASGASGSPVLFTVISTGATTQATVQVVNNQFQPEDTQVKAGGSVTFEWVSGAGPHNVTPVAPNTIPISSDPAPPGTHNAPYSFTTAFANPGTYTYFCGVHGTPTSGMRGSVTVVP